MYIIIYIHTYNKLILTHSTPDIYKKLCTIHQQI